MTGVEKKLGALIDAVNKLKGHFNNNYLLEVNDTVELEHSDGYHSFKTRFKAEVTSLSHFKGEELFKEYLVADKLPAPTKEKQVDYTSEEFWKDAPEGYNAFMPESDDWNASWFKVDGDDVKRMVRLGYSEEFEARSYTVKALLSEGLVLRPQPKPVKPVYTQAMADNGELPPIGSEVTYYVSCKPAVSDENHKHHGEIMDVVGYDGGLAVLLSKNKSFATACNEQWLRPIDTRTSKEKAIDAYIESQHHGLESSSDSIKTIITDAFEAGVTFKGEE